ncbi:alpha/beta hydrolase [Stratiformator vulcanicus]|uniref:Alpha/beta hydrolase family protein n=1 Tax=Stratiformator vulcanicus TaxID=2527980 RepID=A0A517R0Q9_9PLAN|nr:alpha/beta fold hydrolase [Stratiformator vulcanicus]QDT37423.1 Alpha/beta hydrolase family protein [Stratiformator vulcanicus]
MDRSAVRQRETGFRGHSERVVLVVDYWQIALLVVLGVLLALDIGFRIFAVTMALPMFERQPPFNVKESSPVDRATPRDITTRDDRRLAANLISRDDTTRDAVGIGVFFPEFAGSRWSAVRYAAGLRKAGFDLLTVDFRNQGDSDYEPDYKPSHWPTEFEIRDAAAVLRFARKIPDYEGKPLVAFGISRGGSAALIASARLGFVDRVICEGVMSIDAMIMYFTYRWAELYVPRWFIRGLPRWHLASTMKLVRIVSQYRKGVRYVVHEQELPYLKGTPTLIIADGNDSYIPTDIPQKLARRIGDEWATVWVVKKAKHNQARDLNPDEYDRRVAEFATSAVDDHIAGDEADASNASAHSTCKATENVTTA